MLKKRGIIINDELHTGNDLDLLYKGMEEDLPSVKTLTEDIQGADGITDYTEHAGLLPKFSNRYPVFHFFVTGSKREIQSKFEALSRYHGQTVNVFTPDDNEFYYHGRASVSCGEKGARWAYFDFSINAFPYKLKSKSTINTYMLEGKSKIIINNNIMPIKATVKVLDVTDPNPSQGVSYGIKISYNNNTAIIQNGKQAKLKFIIKGGNQTIEVVGGRISETNFLDYNDYGCSIQIIFQEGKF